MRTRAILLALLLCTALPLAGCAPAPEHDELAAFLRERRFSVGRSDRHAQLPFLTPVGFDLTVSETESVQVYEYPNTASAAGEANTIAPDGTPLSAPQWQWGTAPRFYMGENAAIVVYVGKDARIIAALEERYGPPFAGERRR